MRNWLNMLRQCSGFYKLLKKISVLMASNTCISREYKEYALPRALLSKFPFYYESVAYILTS